MLVLCDFRNFERFIYWLLTHHLIFLIVYVGNFTQYTLLKQYSVCTLSIIDTCSELHRKG